MLDDIQAVLQLRAKDTGNNTGRGGEGRGGERELHIFTVFIMIHNVVYIVGLLWIELYNAIHLSSAAGPSRDDVQGTLVEAGTLQRAALKEKLQQLRPVVHIIVVCKRKEILRGGGGAVSHLTTVQYIAECA